MSLFHDALDRRGFCRMAIAGLAAGAIPRSASAQSLPGKENRVTGSEPFATGAEVLAEAQFRSLAGKRVGLITNQTGRVGDAHLADLMHKAPGVKLAAILAPEHGFRGAVEAGEKVGNERDEKTGAQVLSLYGATRKPSPAMLRGIDVLVFDIQDVGVRFYTYISTMGLAMQAAAEAGIPFVVLDRPNPLGGDYVSGFVLEPKLASFVGQYPIPIVHGMTVAELARMIKGERWLAGLDGLKLEVVAMHGWRRHMRWPALQRAWVATSPNIPSFDSALTYPGIGFVGETAVNEGRGTPIPFQQLGAPWLDASRAARKLDGLRLGGVRFDPVKFTPRAIPNVARDPRFEGKEITGVRLAVTDTDAFQPLEAGMHVLAELTEQARRSGAGDIFVNTKMFRAIAGTGRLHAMLTEGRSGADIVASWRDEVTGFGKRRQPYLLY